MSISVRSKISRHFCSIPRDNLVSSRDLLIHGDRSNVDSAIYQLIKRKFIRRVAQGVFIRDGGRTPTIEEIAIFKAEAFGRTIRKGEKNEVATYYIAGSATSFKTVHGRVVLKAVSNKRLHLEDSPTGIAVRNIWTIGEKDLAAIPETLASSQLPWKRNRDALEIAVHSKRWMPGWLGDNFRIERYIGPKRQ